MLPQIAAALLLLNLITFAVFRLDKSLARAQRRRIAEDTLLAMAFFGGTPGAYAARALFRHKTRKQPFSRNLFGIALLHMVILGGGIGWWLAG